jgi:hypothetical protein
MHFLGASAPMHGIVEEVMTAGRLHDLQPAFGPPRWATTAANAAAPPRRRT